MFSGGVNFRVSGVPFIPLIRIHLASNIQCHKRKGTHEFRHDRNRTSAICYSETFFGSVTGSHEVYVGNMPSDHVIFSSVDGTSSTVRVTYCSISTGASINQRNAFRVSDASGNRLYGYETIRNLIRSVHDGTVQRRLPSNRTSTISNSTITSPNSFRGHFYAGDRCNKVLSPVSKFCYSSFFRSSNGRKCSASLSVEGSLPDYSGQLFFEQGTTSKDKAPTPSVNTLTSLPPGDFKTVWTYAYYAVPLSDTSRFGIPPPSDEVLSVYSYPDYSVDYEEFA